MGMNEDYLINKMRHIIFSSKLVDMLKTDNLKFIYKNTELFIDFVRCDSDKNSFEVRFFDKVLSENLEEYEK
jgi:hypothetical protein